MRLDHVPEDDDDLTAPIDQIRLNDAELLRLQRRILRLQRKLRARVDDETWRVYLELEEAVNERGFRLLKLTSQESRRRGS